MYKLSCDQLYDQYNDYLKEKISKSGKACKLLTIRVGEDLGAISYEKSLLKHCKNLGIDMDCKVLEENIGEERILACIDQANEDSSISGILIFQPMLGRYDKDLILQRVNADKDVDGVTFDNKSKILELKDRRNIPATASAIHQFIKAELGDITGKDVLIINRSHIIGIPLFFLLEKDNATVTVAHSKSLDIEGLMKDKDIIISAVGKSEIFSPDQVKEGSIFIDMGISQNSEGKYTGDFNLDSIRDKNVGYMPSIGGIGKITRTIIIENTIINCLGGNYGR
ncbi:MAG: bifunctional 5,10-methylenetetrahydrofolate dehydrogenase/5,10-methenyltetrahydrofolate cyclohydrolase [Tissierellia bacterium]|nr:bifunctional 5,10-methylenetetrahydrofolate dehydrogenase/5,10-methenyltetrahydrofolate cyclohydrolase [Tissierellia bacterium]